jgi:RNA polymerase sigma-70 factor (ECF subfamily)
VASTHQEHPDGQDGHEDHGGRALIDTLAARAQAGDENAWDGLYRACQTQTFRFAQGRVKQSGAVLNTQNVEDVLSEAWLKAFFRIDQYNPDRAFIPWIYRIISNQASDNSRSAWRKRVELTADMVTFEAIHHNDMTGEERQLYVEAHHNLLAQVAKLPEKMRAVVIHCCWEGLDTREAAELVEVSEAYVRQLKSRGLAKLRATLDALAGDQPAHTMLLLNDPIRECTTGDPNA